MDIMIDLETLSTKPDALIVSIGACTFATDGTITARERRHEFYAVIDISEPSSKGGRIDASTVAWWMGQSDQARSIFDQEGAICLQTALLHFKEFCNLVVPRIWGNGASADNVWLRQAYDRMVLNVPWSYRDDRCYRTLKNLRPDIPFEHEGTEHNALDDAIAQAEHAERIFAAMQVAA
jgi:DNA polymerase III epsilon subunit-like protein